VYTYVPCKTFKKEVMMRAPHTADHQMFAASMDIGAGVFLQPAIADGARSGVLK